MRHCTNGADKPDDGVAPVWRRVLAELGRVGQARLFAALAGIVASWLLLMWIAVFAPGWRGVRRGERDEREITERHRSFHLAYGITGFTLVIIWTYAALATVACGLGTVLPLKHPSTRTTL